MGAVARSPHPAPSISPLASLLRCLSCGEPVQLARTSDRPSRPELGPDGTLECTGCGATYALVAGTPRMVEEVMPEDAILKRETAERFAYEWEHFGRLRSVWRRNFLDYMRPHGPDFFEGQLVADVGAGSGRHSRQAVELGARVVAADIGRAVDIARRNLPPEALTVQADAERLPFGEGVFDVLICIGVLHHLPDPERGLRAIVRHIRPGGHLQIYLYWVPQRRVHRALLRLVGAARRITTRLPSRAVHALAYPVALLLLVAVVAPYRVLRRFPAARPLAEALPLKAYADYPFGVLVNDQLDRFSAPVERRYTRAEVERLLRECALEDITVLPHHGWVASARRGTGD